MKYSMQNGVSQGSFPVPGWEGERGRKGDFFDEMGQEVKTSCEEWCVAVDRGPAGRYTKNHAYITDGGLAAEGGME